MDKINDLNLHDSIIEKIVIDPADHIITFELECIVNLAEAVNPNMFKPIRKKAIFTLVNYKKVNIDNKWDTGKETILDFDFLQDEKEAMQFNIYTTSGSEIYISCKEYSLVFVGEEHIEKDLIIIPKKQG